MSKPRKQRPRSEMLKGAPPEAVRRPARNEYGDVVSNELVAPRPDPASNPTIREEWDDIAVEIAGLAPLLRMIEREIDSLNCHVWLNDLPAGQVGSLAGLAHRRLAALDERMGLRRPVNRADWDT
ncbi:MAG TPA: hypothetical protein VH913_12910 [Hyphomicrobiaceae bacterium]